MIGLKKNSTRILLEKVFQEKNDWKNRIYPVAQKDDLRTAISRGKLPKFDRFRIILTVWESPCMIPGQHISYYNHYIFKMIATAQLCITKYRITLASTATIY